MANSKPTNIGIRKETREGIREGIREGTREGTREVFPLTSKKDLKDFIEVAYLVNKNLKNWVPPLRLSVAELLNQKHPFHQTSKMRFWIAYKDGLMVGRIATILNQAYNDFQNTYIQVDTQADKKVGFWGFLEICEEDLQENLREEVLTELFEKAEEALKEEGCEKILGPMNPSTNYECGLLVDGFDDPPQLMMPYNSESLPSFIEKVGYQKEKDLFAYKLSPQYQIPDVIERIATKLEQSENISYRHLKKSDWNNEVETIFEIYNQAWEKNWAFVPFSKQEFVAMANELKMVACEKFILLAEVDKIPVGFVICLPDYNQIFKKIPNGKLLPTGIFRLLFGKKSITRVRVLTLGLIPKYRRRGIETLLYKKITEEVRKYPQYTQAELSWVLEDNLEMNKPLLRMGASPYKTYRIYKKEISQKEIAPK